MIPQKSSDDILYKETTKQGICFVNVFNHTEVKQICLPVHVKNLDTPTLTSALLREIDTCRSAVKYN